jgi:Rad3-related DNA helicase
VPALLSDGKVIISTGTKTLQDQFLNRDLPTGHAALKVPVLIALLKGRANFLWPKCRELKIRRQACSMRARISSVDLAHTRGFGSALEC